MKGTTIAWVACAAVLVLLAAAGYRALNRGPSAVGRSPAPAPSAGEEPAGPSFLYGRVITVGGVIHEGRLRWGGGEEAFWGNYFNGVKQKNPWAAYVPPERLPKELRPFKIFGIEIGYREEPVNLGRLYMARFGDIARIESHGRDVRVTLKSGRVAELDRFSASDFDDGVRVWEGGQRVADLDSLRIRTIEFRAAPQSGAAPGRLHGSVRTRSGEDFRGFVQWDREQCVGSDEIRGQTADGEIRLRFDAIRSIARRSRESSVATLLDGREIELSGTRDAGEGNRGVYVDDARYGRVLVSWDAFERVEFSAGESGPAYSDFPRGGPLMGSLTTRGGRRLAGRLVFDLDESEVTETLDAPSQGVHYTIPFGLIASITVPGEGAGGLRRARVRLHSGEDLLLECTGDLGEKNAGMLVFAGGGQSPDYVRWEEVGQIDFDRPGAMYPPPGNRSQMSARTLPSDATLPVRTGSFPPSRPK
jgi:hypothetical protein